MLVHVAWEGMLSLEKVCLTADELSVSDTLLGLAHMAKMKTLQLSNRRFIDNRSIRIFATLIYYKATESPAVNVSCGYGKFASSLASNVSEFKARRQDT